jgi:hypothetical protein
MLEGVHDGLESKIYVGYAGEKNWESKAKDGKQNEKMMAMITEREGKQRW